MAAFQSVIKGAGAAAALLVGLAGIAFAQSPEESPPTRLGVTLNTVATTEAGGCRLTFVVRNELDADIDKLVAEAVLFDAEGRVAVMTLFDFGSLPAARPRVRQFDMTGQSCEALGEVLINGIGTCEGEGLDPATCLDGLRLSTDTEIEVTG